MALGSAGLALAIALGLAAAAPGRAAAPLDAEQEVRMLMGQGLDLARGVLLAGSVLRPFAFVMRPDGKVQRLVPSASGSPPPADELLDALEAGLHEQALAGALRGSAVFVDVVVAHEGAESEALQARLEHVAGYCIDIFYLYSRDADGAVRFGEPVTRARKGTIFAGCGDTASEGGAVGAPERYDPDAEEQDGDEGP
ncbi:MAG: hypothetical protein QNK04_05135 [Myxococcota bacterium]|nr:hypothetical protein [Myxococcota bacterium]